MWARCKELLPGRERHPVSGCSSLAGHPLLANAMRCFGTGQPFPFTSFAIGSRHGEPYRSARHKTGPYNAAMRSFSRLLCSILLLQLVGCASPVLQPSGELNLAPSLEAGRVIATDGMQLPLSLWQPEGKRSSMFILSFILSFYHSFISHGKSCQSFP